MGPICIKFDNVLNDVKINDKCQKKHECKIYIQSIG